MGRGDRMGGGGVGWGACVQRIPELQKSLPGCFEVCIRRRGLVWFGLVGWALHAAESSGKEKLKPRGCKVWAQGLLEPAASTAQSRRPSRPWTGPDLWPLAHSLSLPHQLSLRVLTSCPSDSRPSTPSCPHDVTAAFPTPGAQSRDSGDSLTCQWIQNGGA